MDMMDYFLNQLQEGKDIDSLASLATKALNEANNRYKAKANKLNAANAVAEGFDKFLREYYPNVACCKDAFLSGSDIIEACDILNSLSDTLEEIQSISKNSYDDKEKPRVNKNRESDDEIQKVLNRFLDSLK